MKNLIIVISGPSGAGKGTIIKKLLQKNSDFRLIISYTTRNKRQGEQDGKDYNFISREEFQELINKKEIIEYNEYDGNYYGTPKINFASDKEVIIVETNAENGLKFKKENCQIITIYIMPKDEKQLIKQRGNRGSKRHELGKKEINIAQKYNWLVVNEDINDAIEQIEEVIKVSRRNSLNSQENIEFLNNFYS